MKSENWISGTGRSPYIAMPMAAPMMPASASGVSMTRSAPNSSISPSVARKTPPNLPTSSPSTTTRGSRRISIFSASLTAWMMFHTGISRTSVRVLVARQRRQVGALALELGRQLREHVVEHALDGRQPDLLGVGQRGGELIGQLLPVARLELARVDAAPLEVRSPALDRIAQLPLLGFVGVAVHVR